MLFCLALQEKGKAILSAGAKADEEDKVGKGVRPSYTAGYGAGWTPVVRRSTLRHAHRVACTPLAAASSRPEAARCPKAGFLHRVTTTATIHPRSPTPQGPPHKQRYLSFSGAPAAAFPAAAAAEGSQCGAMLGAVREELFGSEAFAKLLWALTELHPTATRSEVGLSYGGLTGLLARPLSPRPLPLGTSHAHHRLSSEVAL